MINRVGAFILVSTLGVGCGVGDDAKVEPIDPNPNGLVCTDAFKITGTFTPGTPARPTVDPEDPTVPFTGCWPFGTWNFTVTRDPLEDNIQDITGDAKGDRCGAVSGTQIATFDASYSFIATRTPDPNSDFIDSYSLAGQTVQGGKTFWNDKYLFKLKVTEGGGGECEAGIELYDRGGTNYWNLHPSLKGTTINGFGDFGLYEEPQI
ncbi:MAG TPA: hypothetical protein VNO30_20110 [Kofleriaceae bacterium]|nr:hypothetical protein [Kofleriaceae bacterium]